MVDSNAGDSSWPFIGSSIDITTNSVAFVPGRLYILYMIRAPRNPLRIVKLLHSGENGDLVLGHYLNGGSAVVVKYLRDHKNPNARRAFANQVRVLSRQYNGAIPLWSADLEAERPYYVMPYLQGGNLVRSAGWLSDGQLRAVAWRLAQTLAVMHSSFDVHGDLKPDNVLIDSAGEAWLADPLGNPMIWSSWMNPNRGGTPGYWAPEVHAGNSITTSADIYSLGATLYHLLTGNRPQDGNRLDTLIDRFPGDTSIRQLISLCCNPVQSERPTAHEVLRVLSGETWSEIQTGRVRSHAAAFACFVVAACLIFSPLIKGRFASISHEMST